MENKCLAGCKKFHGGEIQHHKDCPYYEGSLSQMYDDLKWQQERMYSEQDMDNYAEYCINHFAKSQIGQPYLSAKEWFKQFKKEEQ
jgi:hypothetical protein